MWNRKHAEGQHDWFADSPSGLATILTKMLKKGSTILEIGCGNGRDARYFANNSMNVTATDFSRVAIEKNLKSNTKHSLKFSVLDIRDPFPYSNNSYDAVYSSLALHYYSDKKTREIFHEIHRVLNEDGLIAFSCKEYDEVRMKGAKIVEPDIYVDKNGHVLHAFSERYINELCNGLFEIIVLESKDEEYGGRVSTIVSCIARKL